MAVTPNLNLYKPDGEDYVSLSRDLNENYDKIDTAVGSNSDAIAKILPVISGTTNNSGYAISAGEYFEANGKLYKATASIPTGNAWSSSATELSDHGAINALNSKIANIIGTIVSYHSYTNYSFSDNGWQSCIQNNWSTIKSEFISRIRISNSDICVIPMPMLESSNPTFNENYGACIVFGRDMNSPFYGKLNNGTWTWKNLTAQ